jgi:D-glycero-D-manno-heptose 1,7-bisphosphate phosphatase
VGTMAASAVFLDRDGVIIENRPDDVKSWDEVRFLPGAVEALRRLGATGHAVVVVTNQGVVGRGTISLAEATELNRRVIAAIEAGGGRVDAAYLCPHRAEDGCGCRKPAPGMLLRAGADLGLDLGRSYLVGDAVTDLEAARAAGALGILVLTGRGRDQAALLAGRAVADCPVVADLPAALERVLAAPEGAAR